MSYTWTLLLSFELFLHSVMPQDQHRKLSRSIANSENVIGFSLAFCALV